MHRWNTFFATKMICCSISNTHLLTKRLLPLAATALSVPSSSLPSTSVVAGNFSLSSLVISQRHQLTPPIRRELAIHDSFLNSASSEYIELMYDNYKKDPHSVDDSWKEIFDNAAKINSFDEGLLNEERKPKLDASSVAQSLLDCCRLTWIIQAFEDKGHLLAITDPLNTGADEVKRLPQRRSFQPTRLDLEYFGYIAQDYNRNIKVGFMENVGGLLGSIDAIMTVKGLHDYLSTIYCGYVGYEFTHIIDKQKQQHIRDSIESPDLGNSSLHQEFSKEEKLYFLRIVANAVLWEDLLQRKYSTKKRFGLDGGESFVLGMDTLFERFSDLGAKEVVVAMAHRGRLNSLVNLFGKPAQALLKEFKGVKQTDLDPYDIRSDAKYHLGSRVTQTYGYSKKELTAEVLNNPSHLEAANPVCQGKVKATQIQAGDFEGHNTIPIEVHGDAAIAGQGISYETMAISEIACTHTGGTIHVVINNQIGFTTDPRSSRSAAYSSDIGRVFQCPIIHVNGDRPEDVVRVFRFAADYRMKFRSSIVIDFVCYRRYGHNETDVPHLTQPHLYKIIQNHPDILTLYGKRLIAENSIHKKDFDNVKREISDGYNKAFDEVAKGKFNYSEYLTSTIPEHWKEMATSCGKPEMQLTAVSKDKLEPVIKAITKLPDNFKTHPFIEKMILESEKSLQTDKNITWRTGEALAIGSLLQENIHVHMYGQDIERGAFQQRNAVLHAQTTPSKTYSPLQHISQKQAQFIIHNSPVTEYGTLGFELGYSLYNPQSLCIWEAQLAEFSNGAQISIDQFIASGETKWNMQQNVVMSLPYYYSPTRRNSSFIERFLQLCDDDEMCSHLLNETDRLHRCNIEITCSSNPAQYFHLLRRHVKRNFRKPWANFVHARYFNPIPGAFNTSSLSEFTDEKHGGFQPLLSPPRESSSSSSSDSMRRVVFCCGELYHQLCMATTSDNKIKNKKNDVAVVSIEQFSPFPVAEVKQVLKQYKNAQEVVWAQEQPENFGPLMYVMPRLDVLTIGTGKKLMQFTGEEMGTTVKDVVRAVLA